MRSEEQIPSFYRHVGGRIRERRKLLKLNQSQLAQLIGVSYQQIQKYESGASQINLNRLLQIANALNVNPNYFYEGLKFEDDSEPQSASDIIRQRSRPMNVLLVEDNAGDVLLFKRALKDLENEVQLHIIHDAEQVMEYLLLRSSGAGASRPDLVILDLSLPKINGLHLLQQIKKHPDLVDLPVVILTNSISIKEMREAYRQGASSFIQKSVEFDEFSETIGTAIHYWSKTVVLPHA